MAYHGKYDTPDAVLKDKHLSRGEKIEMLESWRDDKEAYMRASDDGMRDDDRSHLMKDIDRALTSLRGQDQSL